MSIECPNCKEAREQAEDAAEGWLHRSADYPPLLHCNCCGRYFRKGDLALVEQVSLPAYHHPTQVQPK